MTGALLSALGFKSYMKNQPPYGDWLFKQREKDLNPRIRSQSPLCYPYTIPLNAKAIILAFEYLSIYNVKSYEKNL